jgi:hypothetical protein
MDFKLDPSALTQSPDEVFDIVGKLGEGYAFGGMCVHIFDIQFVRMRAQGRVPRDWRDTRHQTSARRHGSPGDHQGDIDHAAMSFTACR